MTPDDASDPERAAHERRARERALERELTEELRASVRREVEDEVRRRTRSEVLHELEHRAPTDDERARCRALIDEIELDAYAQATLASREADEAERALERSRRLGGPAVYAAALASPLLSYACARWLSDPTAVAAALVTLATALGLLVSTTLRRNARLERRLRELRRVASDFTILAERARAYRLVHAERIAEAQELVELVEELRLAKEAQDRQYHPSTADLEVARDTVRHRIEAPPEPLRVPAPRVAVASPDEDARLADASDAAEAEVARLTRRE
ncbi:MAG: hypothetical protein IT373_15540 [Polyangiaceae bacterium]|nr:hypothetical protein [Polyangiaceae bacterium]